MTAKLTVESKKKKLTRSKLNQIIINNIHEIETGDLNNKYDSFCMTFHNFKGSGGNCDDCPIYMYYGATCEVDNDYDYIEEILESIKYYKLP